MTNHLTLDGVTQAPGRPDEDRRGGSTPVVGRWPRAARCPSAGRPTRTSTTLEEPLPWGNSTLLAGDAAEAVSRLGEQAGRHIAVLGSGELARSLMRHELVDLFPDGVPIAALTLVDSLTTTTDVVIATYPAAA